MTACYGADTQILGPSVVGIEALGVRRDPSVFLTGSPLFPTVEITAVVRGMRVPRQQWRVGEFFCSWEKGAEMKTKNYRRGGKSVSRRRLANTESRGLIMMMMMSVALARAPTDAEQMDPLVMCRASRVQVAERQLEKV